MTELKPHPLRVTFESQPIVLQLGALHSSSALPKNVASGKKFLQILASIAVIGLVEPLIVARIKDNAGGFRILDGRLRVEALRRLGLDDALCVVATDDEAYTYNKYISRLTSAQDARMIAQAIEHGVPRERIASVLGIEVDTVKRRASLLDGISHEAASLLADKPCPATTFQALKQLKPVRQIAAVELMCGQGNFTSAFARAIVGATPPEQIEHANERKTSNDVTEQLIKLERELATLQTAVAQTDERYGVEHLHLTVSIAYIATLLDNERIGTWLNERRPDFFAQFEIISQDARTARFRSNSSEPKSKTFRRVDAKAAPR
ncbi:plasmid partitioning protein RepB C-terminal domain-containing protein [Paraburkholderia sp. FT54]|uniref:plasmid partitioning protein RepB C-terminal domain-containing protein n=1 Tax=Paraburkholderia sp. FT54 TaxID=3074437 RepID=UPI002877C54A|nr:plasmid partitioning protein RepB C-terminal domain-containing protein [Paraburkholderia sp. FT54]WNC95045.1 plasmid partitioning protein RepB C-terminal domain-containing protein [Paraburkholderia sp. FT54]